jgi:GRASP55/65 PDZ-like domain
MTLSRSLGFWVIFLVTTVGSSSSVLTSRVGSFKKACRSMGNSSSANSNGVGNQGDDPLDPFDGIDTLGYRVLGVQPNSPASEAGLVSFLDFLVGCNEKMLLGSGEDLEPGMEYDDVDLPALLEENKGKELEFCTC